MAMTTGNKVRMGLIAGLIVANMTIIDKIFDKLNEIENLNGQIIKEQSVQKKEIQKKADKVQAPYDYTTDMKWSRGYSNKNQNRHVRFDFESECPTFKSKWTTWSGKAFIDRAKLVEITEIVLRRLPHIRVNENTINLVVETAIAESQGGYHIDHSGGDYGIFQIRINTAKGLMTWLKENHKDVYESVEQFRNKKLSIADNLEQNIPFGVALCITEYWRKAGGNYESYITSVHDRGVMWKSVYNTKFGRGTVKAYVSRNDNHDRIVAKFNKRNETKAATSKSQKI